MHQRINPPTVFRRSHLPLLLFTFQISCWSGLDACAEAAAAQTQSRTDTVAKEKMRVVIGEFPLYCLECSASDASMNAKNPIRAISKPCQPYSSLQRGFLLRQLRGDQWRVYFSKTHGGADRANGLHVLARARILALDSVLVDWRWRKPDAADEVAETRR
jgi:hypothetical protein